MEQELATSEDLRAIEQKVQAIVDDAVAFAEESPEPKPEELYDYIFADE